MSSSKKLFLQRDFAVGVYHSLQTGDSQFLEYTFSHVGIFNSALRSVLSPVTPLPFTLVQLSPLPPFPASLSPCVNNYCILYTRILCEGGV
jgi:hypothetical protein